MSKAKKKSPSYEEAFAELQTIIEKIQNDEIGIDQLSENISRSVELIKFCKQKLRKVDHEIESLFEGE